MSNDLDANLSETQGLITTKGSRLLVGGAFLGVYIPFEVLEPYQPITGNTMVRLVKQLNRDDALLMCGFLNCVTSGSGPGPIAERQRAAYSPLYTQSDAEKINAWISQQNARNGAILFFRGQLLEIMRWISRFSCSRPGIGRSFDSVESRQIFIRAAFLAAELWSKRTFAGKLIGAATDPDALDRALGAFRKGVEESATAMHIGIAMARGKFLFEVHMPIRLPEFCVDFRNATGLSIGDFFVCASMLMMKVFAKPIDGYFFRATYADATAADAKFRQFLASSSQGPDELSYSLWEDFETFGFKALRERPILLTSSGQCIVLDPTFFVEYFTISPLFKVASSSRSRGKALAAFGFAFEDYAVSILKRMYPEIPYLAKRLHTDVLHQRVNPAFQIDALINDVDELVIIEMKSAFIPEESLISLNSDDFLKELRKRYAFTGDPNDREVGVAQLAKCVRAIVLDKWIGAEIDQIQLKRIFPVLVVHDERMGSPGVGVFLNRIFFDILGDVGARVRVEPLIIMTIHDLENIESSETFYLRELLAQYVKKSRGGMTSLRNFMAMDPGFRNKIRPSKPLMDKSFEILDQLQQLLFPNSDGSSHPTEFT